MLHSRRRTICTLPRGRLPPRYSALPTYWGARTANNKASGIFQEISYDATVKNNTIVTDAFDPAGNTLSWRAKILIVNSANVEVANNTVTNSMNGIGGIMSNRGNGTNGLPYEIQNLNVHDNTITQTTGTAAGIAVQGGLDNSVFTSWNNHFQNNTFILATPATYDYFCWLGQNWTLAQWNT